MLNEEKTKYPINKRSPDNASVSSHALLKDGDYSSVPKFGTLWNGPTGNLIGSDATSHDNLVNKITILST